MKTLPLLPEGITCPDWESIGSGSRRCRYYGEPGGCLTDRHLVCIEYEKKNAPKVDVPPAAVPLQEVLSPPLARASERIDTREADPSAFQLEPTAPAAVAVGTLPGLISSSAPLAAPKPKKPPKPAAAARARAAWTALTGAEAPVEFADGAPYVPALAAVDPAEIERLEKLADEIHITSEAGHLVLVPEHADPPRSPDVIEMTFREAAFLRLVVDAFPGARVTKLLTPAEAARQRATRPALVAEPDYRPPHIEPQPLHPAGGTMQQHEADEVARKRAASIASTASTASTDERSTIGAEGAGEAWDST